MMENGTAQAMPGALTQIFGKGNGDQDDIWKLLLLGGWGGGLGGFGRQGVYGAGAYGAGAAVGAAAAYPGCGADSVAAAKIDDVKDMLKTHMSDEGFKGLTAQISAFATSASEGRHTSDLNINNQFSQLCTQFAQCCCETQKAIAEVNTNIALGNANLSAQMCSQHTDILLKTAETQTQIALQGAKIEHALCEQTHQIESQATSNTTQILDHIASNERSRLEQQAADLRTQLVIAGQTKETDSQFATVNLTLLAIQNELNGGHHGH